MLRSADALGSPRAITDISGNVVSRHDYMPFGEEVYAGTGGRTSAQGYLQTIDGVRQQFTGYEKDLESGLDYAQARYYSGKHGRFTSVDPLTASASIKSPQTFNRYSYALNSPYKFTDPLGLQPKCQGPGGGQTSSCDGNDENGAPLRPDCPECVEDTDGRIYGPDEPIKVDSPDCPAGSPCSKPPVGGGPGGPIIKTIVELGGGLLAGAGSGGATIVGTIGGIGTIIAGGSGGGSGGGAKNAARTKASIAAQIAGNNAKIAGINVKIAELNKELMNNLGIYDGLEVTESEILDLALEYLGDTSVEDPRTPYRYTADEGTRVVRLTKGDLDGHGGKQRPHFNFEIFTPNSNTDKLERIVNAHVYFR